MGMRKGEGAALGLAPAASLAAEVLAERRTDLAAKVAIFRIGKALREMCFHRRNAKRALLRF